MAMSASCPKPPTETIVDLIGVPYLANGWDPAHGLSCWGCVHLVYRRHGILLPQDVFHAARLFVPATKPYHPLDVLYFTHRPLIPDHLAVMISSSEYLHCSEATGGVAKRSLYTNWTQRVLASVFRYEGSA